MICKHWNPQTYFCNCEQKTVNPDDLGTCQEICENYVPVKKDVTVVCMSCGNEFLFNEKKKLEIEQREFAICPVCGHVNMKTDDECLSRGLK